MKKFIINITAFFKKIYPVEILISVIIVCAVNYFFFKETPGFFNTVYNPFFLVIIFFSSFYGKLSGIFTLLISLLGIIIIKIIPDIGASAGAVALLVDYVRTDSDSIIQFLFMSFILSIIFGGVRDSLGMIIQRHKNNVEEMTAKNNKLEYELKAISMVNEEYQDRILGQQNSLISLYTTMIELNSLDLKKIYPSILEAVKKFSGAGKCSLWEYLRDEHMLNLLAFSGWEEEPAEYKISDTNSITGWVARNNEVFSIKLLQKHSNLLEIDNKQNIITVPIKIGNHVWGVINIEEMPFIKYNMYSEQLIMMIADLTAPIISNAIRFDEISRKGEIDEITGLPSIDEMFSILREEFASASRDNSKLSLVVFELVNSDDLLSQYAKDQVRVVFRDIIQVVRIESKKDSLFFQYKDEYQFSMILPNMDYDGTAMLALNLIEKINTNEFKIDNNVINPEIILGYSSMRSNLKSEEDLMMLAENLLEMQKI